MVAIESILLICREFISPSTYCNNNCILKGTNVSQLTVATVGHGSSHWMCNLESALLEFLSSRYNVSYRDYDRDLELQKLSKSQNVDVILQEYSAGIYTYNEGWSLQWIEEEYNFVIMSALYSEPKNFFKFLMNTFSFYIWISIFISVFIIGFVVLVEERQNDRFLNKRNHIKDFGKVFLKICGSLLNQGISEKKYLILNIWSLTTIVLVHCYSSSILSSLLFQPMKTINSFEELVKSNLDLVTGNYSDLYYAHQWPGDDPKLNYIHKRISSRNDEDEYVQKSILEDVIKKKIAYIREGQVIESQLLTHPEFKPYASISKNKYFETLIGYLVNRIHSKTRKEVEKYIKYSVEAGLYKKWRTLALEEMRLKGLRKINTSNSASDENTKTPLPIGFKMMIDLFIFISFGFVIAEVSFILEFVLYKLSRLYIKNKRLIAW